MTQRCRWTYAQNEHISLSMNTGIRDEVVVLERSATEHRAISVNCSMPPETIAAIDRIARAEGLSRSAVVRRAVLLTLRLGASK